MRYIQLNRMLVITNLTLNGGIGVMVKLMEQMGIFILININLEQESGDSKQCLNTRMGKDCPTKSYQIVKKC